MVRGSELDIAVRASIVSLRFGAGLKSVEIASMLNIDPGTVRTTCYRMKRAAKSEDLLELLKHCRTKKRSGRPSVKNTAAVAAGNANASPSAAEDDDKDNQHEALSETAASTSPDPLAENFETTAWPERDLTAAATADTNTNTTHSQPTPALSQYHNPLPSETLPYTTFDQSIAVLRAAKEARPELITKTSIMLGLGETEDQLWETLKRLREVGVDVVTFGQYMRPTKRHMKVEEYVTPATFELWRQRALDLGFMYCASGPLVRSSYKAGEAFIENVLKKRAKKSQLFAAEAAAELEATKST